MTISIGKPIFNGVRRENMKVYKELERIAEMNCSIKKMAKVR